MGNCQAIDNATLVIQHPNGKVDNLFFPVPASTIINANPGHYVALLLTTTLYSSTAAAANKDASAAAKNLPLRVTRIKILRPTDTLLLGHVYRLVTSQEVMKGLWAKKQAKMHQKNGANVQEAEGNKSNNQVKVKQERQRSRNKTQVNSAAAAAASTSSRAWQPALKSISEAAN